MAPIRVGIIGLSSSADQTTEWASKAHLPYLLHSPHYKITALCNSSKAAAEKAVKRFNLPAETKTYGSPDDIANDPDVDLVVVVTRVDRHAQVGLPALRAGKAVFCEWPVDRNLAVAKEMLEAAKQGGARTIVGAQAPMDHVVRKVKSLIEEGKIGRVLSSTLVGALNAGGTDQSVDLAYFLDREIGGNFFTIGFGHVLSYVLYTLGEVKTFSSLLATQIKETPLVDRKTNTVVEIYKKTTPDQILFQAELETGTVLSLHIRADPPKPDNHALTWRIFGTKGEIEVVSPFLYLNVGSDDTKITLHERSTGKVADIAIPRDEFESLPRPARNIARQYEGFATGNLEGIPDIEAALKRHALIEEMYRRWDTGEQTSSSGLL